jgi:hypothetical protein
MATYGILGTQTKPAATTLTTLVTGGTNGTIVSGFAACNTTGSSDSIRVALTPSGGTTAAQHYVYYDFVVPANSTIQETPGWTLGNNETLKVYSTNGNIAFTATGVIN